jgi:hypothetical protein
MLDNSDKTIARLQTTIVKQQELLDKANKSFETFAKESKAQIKKAQWERNAAVVAIVATLFLRK